MKSTTATALRLAAALTACAYNPPRVPLEGPPADLEALAGQWDGRTRARTAAGAASLSGSWPARTTRTETS